MPLIDMCRYLNSVTMPIDPILSALLQTPQVQRQQSTERAAAIRRSQERVKSAGLARGDLFEHQVESSEEVASIHDDNKEHPDQQKRRQQHPKPDTEEREDNQPPPSIDVTA